MITAVTNDKCYEFRGMRADFEEIKEDEKFNKGVGNGSIFFIIDESVVYMFNEADQVWVELK